MMTQGSSSIKMGVRLDGAGDSEMLKQIVSSKFLILGLYDLKGNNLSSREKRIIIKR